MGFLNVLGDISKNRNNFKKWEKEERDKDAKRKALYKANPVSSDVLAEKQKLANTIIDTITIMDQHSEDVAEDVETMTQPITSISLMGGFMAAGIPGLTFLQRKYKEKYKNISAVESKLSPELIKKVIEANKKINSEYDATRQILHPNKNKHINIPQDLKEQVKNIRAEVVKINKQFAKYPFMVFGTIIASGIGAFLASVLITTNMQVGSSRIARFQSRKNLENAKNFVVYTDEQVEQAKENLKNKPEEKKSFWSKSTGKDDEKTGLVASYRNIKNLIVDKKRYNKWKKENSKKDFRVMRNLTPEELDEAKRDKEVIQRLTRKINNKAEEYSTNMETAAGVILGSSLLGGPILGGSVSWVLNLLGIGDKISASLIKKMTDESTVKIYNKLKELDSESVEYKKLKKSFNESIEAALYPEKVEYEKASKKFREYIEERDVLLDKLKNEKRDSYYFEQFKKLDKKYGDIRKIYNAASDKYFSKNRTSYEETKINAKSILSSALSTKAGRNKVLAFASGVVSTVVGMFIALKLQKQASRAGRYVAKEEFRNNPQEFIAYTDEEMNEVSDVKAEEKTLGQKFKNYMMFLPTVFKQHREYMNYKKGDYKKEKALRDELVKLDVTPEQLREGKNLQRKLFNTFEKIDDKSQEYSENMEAASDIAMQFSILGGYAALIAPLVLTGAAITSGKTSPSKIMASAGEFLSRFSFIANSKFFKNYLSDVAKNFETRVINNTVSEYKLDNLSGVLRKLCKNINDLKNAPENENILKLLKVDISPFLNVLQKSLNSTASVVVKGMKNLDEKTINSLSDKLKNITNGNVMNMLRALLENPIDKLSNSEVIKSVIKASGLDFNEKEIQVLTALFKNFSGVTEKSDKLANVICDIIKKTGLDKKNPELVNKILENVPLIDANEILAGKSNIEKQLNALLNSVSPEVMPQDIAMQKVFSDAQIERYQNILNKILENKKQILKIAKIVERVAKNIPLNELSNAVQKVINIAIEEPQKFVLLLDSPDNLKSILMTKSVKKALLAAGISWGVFVTAVIFTVQSYFAKLQREAGRLGVMKAMEELKDDRIYADVEPKQPVLKGNNQAFTTANLPDNIKNLLNR